MEQMTLILEMLICPLVQFCVNLRTHLLSKQVSVNLGVPIRIVRMGVEMWNTKMLRMMCLMLQIRLS